MGHKSDDQNPRQADTSESNVASSGVVIAKQNPPCLKLVRNTDVLIYELISTATLNQMFRSINTNLNSLVFTKYYIENFISSRRTYFLKPWIHATFFLFEEKGRYMIYQIRSKDGELHWYECEIEMMDCAQWLVDRKRKIRVIVPLWKKKNAWDTFTLLFQKAFLRF